VSSGDWFTISRAASKPVKGSASILSAKIRRIRVDQRTIAVPNSSLMDADSADLRGSRSE